MAKITGKLQSLVDGQLNSDEKLLVGVRVNLKGTALGVGMSALGSAPAVVIGSETMSEGQQQASDAGISFSQQMALGLTDKRILVWKRSAFTGKPKEIIGEIQIDNIVDVSLEPGTLGDMLNLKFSNEKELELESVKIDNGKDFADKLKELIGNNA
jgi:Bacterial PH domain